MLLKILLLIFATLVASEEDKPMIMCSDVPSDICGPNAICIDPEEFSIFLFGYKTGSFCKCDDSSYGTPPNCKRYCGNGCDVDQHCDISKNICRPGCENELYCNADQYCDHQSNKCKKGCRNDNACGDDKYCSQVTRECTKGCRDSISSCNTDEYCNPESKICTKGCESNGKCNDDEFCDRNRKVCMKGCRSNQNCGDDEVCNVDGQCQKGCRHHEQCGSDEYCDFNESTCKKGCWQNEGCKEDEFCHYPTADCKKGCRSDENCKSDEYCDNPYGECKAGCRLSSQTCSGNQICDFDTHNCRNGCTKSSDCGKDERCFIFENKCRKIPEESTCGENAVRTKRNGKIYCSCNDGYVPQYGVGCVEKSDGQFDTISCGSSCGEHSECEVIDDKIHCYCNSGSVLNHPFAYCPGEIRSVMKKVTMRDVATLLLASIFVIGTVYIGIVKTGENSAHFSFNNLEISNQLQNNSIDHQKIITQSDLVENEVAKQIYDIIDHFKDDDPVGLPFPIPDPVEIPKIVQKKYMVTLTLNPIYIHGSSNFRIESAAVELDKLMQGSCSMTFDEIVLKGNYTLKQLIGGSRGPFTIVIKKLNVFGQVKLAVVNDGVFRAHEVESDMNVAKMSVNFENLGGLKDLLTSFVNSEDGSFFKMIKPYILNDSRDMIKKIINDKIDEYLSEYKLLPNSIAPIDFAIAEVRRYVRAKFDPFKIDDYENLGAIGYRIIDTELNGISSFYRVGDIKTRIENKIATLDVEVGTQEIHGKTTWEVSLAKGMISRAGRIQFIVQYIKVKFQVSQPIDLSKRLKLNDLDIDLGNIQILSSGLGTFDYVIEFLLNTLPNLLRGQIMDVIRNPIMERIQKYANQIDTEVFVKEKVKEYFETGSISVKFPLNSEL